MQISVRGYFGVHVLGLGGSGPRVMFRRFGSVRRAGMRWLEEPCDAFFHDDDLVFDSGGLSFAFQQLERLINRLVRKAERAIVHGHHPTRFEIEEGRDGISRAGVHVAECWRIVGSDGEQGEFGRQTAADLRKAAEICRIAGMVDGVFAAAQDVAAITAVGILNNAGAPMARGYVRDFKRTEFVRVPPLELDDVLKAKVGDEIQHMVRNDQNGSRAPFVARLPCDCAQRLPVQVIEMRVSNEDDIHGRQIAQVEAGLAQPLQNE